MTSDACREMRAAVGAAALAGLDPVHEVAMRAHLDGCADCRAELRDLTSVARALPLADPARIEQATPQPSPGLAERVLDGVARQRARRRTRVRRRVLAAAAAVAVAAAIVAALLVVPRGTSGGTEIAFPSHTPGVVASATLRPRPSGTEVLFHVGGLHEGDYYWLWLTNEDGERVGAGPFRGPARPVDITMTAAIRLERARR